MLKFIFGIVLIGTGFIKAIFHDPIWGIYLFAALAHIRVGQLGESIHIPLQIPIVIATTTIILYVFGGQYKQKFNHLNIDIWLFALMVVGMAICSANATFRSDLSWQFTFDYTKYWVFFVLFVNMINSIEKVEWFHRVLILSAAYLVYRCWDLRGMTGPRFENPGGDNIADGNMFAAALVMLFPFVFQKVFNKNRWVAAGAITLCFGIIMSIFISGSRGGYLGLAALFILILVNFKEHRKQLLAVMCLIGLVSVLFMNDYQLERIQELFSATSAETRDGSAQGRIDFWKLAWRLFNEYPVAGVGLGNFPYFSGYLVEGLPYGKPGHVTHSLWFEVLSEGGLVVTLPFVALLFRFFRNTKRLINQLLKEGRREEALYIVSIRIALGAFFVTATFLNRLVYEPMYWCLGLGVIHGYLARNTNTAKTSKTTPMLAAKSVISGQPNRHILGINGRHHRNLTSHRR